MAIDTKIDGSPASVSAAAETLRTVVAKELDSCADSANDVRRDASNDWEGEAGREFVKVSQMIRQSGDGLAGASRSAGRSLDVFATALRRCQNEMAGVRSSASQAGLTVSGSTIEYPGAGPVRPPDDFVGTPDEVAAHNDRVKAYDAHQDLLRAYQTASGDATRIDEDLAEAASDLLDALTSQAVRWALDLGSKLMSKIGEEIKAKNILRQRNDLLKQADELDLRAQRISDALAAKSDRYKKRFLFFFKRLDRAKMRADRNEEKRLRKEADQKRAAADKVKNTSNLAKGLRFAGRALGPIGLGLGVYSDYQNGESLPQALLSQGAATAVSSGTTALGTAVGALGGPTGAAVGTGIGWAGGVFTGAFTDGAVDSLFENGWDVKKAWNEGRNSVGETAGDIGDGARWVGGKIGDAGRGIKGIFD